jgi:hypothetical protein
MPDLVIHPTILIGYGEYAEGVLRRLLINALDRGVLQWLDTDNGVRRLNHLAFFHVKDSLEGTTDENRYTEATDRFEMMRDLFAQIEEVEADPQAICSKIEDAARHLLRGTLSSEASGLDIVILSSPAQAESLGALMTLMQPAMRELSKERMLAAVRGQELLNFSLLLDFEHYWQDSPRAEATRNALFNVLDPAEESRDRKNPRFGRIYLFNGWVKGYRDARTRLEELVLFLEFALFEGQRHNDELRSFFQRHPDEQSVICAAGIRTIEQNTGLLVRLASAAFSINWLQYLIRNKRTDVWRRDTRLETEGEPSALKRQLEAFFPDRLSETLGQDSFRQWIDAELQSLEQTLLEGSDGERWVEELQREGERHRFLLKKTAAGRVRHLLRDAVGAKFQSLSANLDIAIAESLQDERAGPRTIGSLLAELDQLQAEMEAPIPLRETGRLEESSHSFADIEKTHGAFLWFRAGLLQTERFKQWWPYLAFICALGFLPLGIETISEFSYNSGSSSFLQFGNRLLQWVAGQSIVLGLAFIGCAWLTGRYGFHKAVAKRAEAALKFYTDPGRGRLISSLRAWLRSDAFRGDLERYTERAYRGLLSGFLIRARHEVRRVHNMLDLRLHEVEWLQGQLKKYLDRFNVVINEEKLAAFRAERPVHPFRIFTETNADLAQIARRVHNDEGYYATYQAAHPWFSGWNQAFCDTFLHPLQFLDRVSSEFTSTDGAVAHDFRNVDHWIRLTREQLEPGFGWLNQEAQNTQAYCLIPYGWFTELGIQLQLKEQGFNHQIQSKSNDRAYFLKLQTGIAVANLKRVDV